MLRNVTALFSVYFCGTLLHYGIHPCTWGWEFPNPTC